MKTIGMIGGMSWKSSLEYYRIINQLISQQLGGFHSAKILMFSVDFEPVEQLQREDNWERLTDLLIDAAKRLERGGADCILICANTMHKTADKVQDAIAIPILHIADATAQSIRNTGITNAGLLGTRYTMEHEFLKKRFTEKHGLNILIPDEHDRTIIHDIIFNELVKGIINPESKKAYQSINQKMIDRGAEGIILGCTEIPLLIHPEDCPVPSFDTTLLHAKAAVEFALS